MRAFETTLASFCQEVLGMDLDVRSMIVLESSTPQKFSKHVLVQRLLDKDSKQVFLAFANNAQAGLFVSELMNYARANREGSPAQHLFVNAPKSDAPDWRETTMIDESVYSRNRSFRLLFQSKFAKKRRLDLDEASGKRFFEQWRPHPSRAMLETMVTFVPPGTELFRHALIPEGFEHTDAKGTRVQRGSSLGSVVGRSVDQQDPLLNHLVRAWDRERGRIEKGPFLPTAVQSCVEMDRRFLTVTLLNNRFCFCKGSSHVSNHVYMVVDLERRCFYQTLLCTTCSVQLIPPSPPVLGSSFDLVGLLSIPYKPSHNAHNPTY